MGFPTIRDQFVYPTIIHYPLFLYPLFVTRHKLAPSLCIPATAARTWEEKGFVGTWSDGGKGGRVTFQNGGGVSLPSRITKRHSGSVQFSRLRQVPLAIRQCFECIYGYIYWIYPTRISFDQGYIYQKLSVFQQYIQFYL